MTSLEEELAEFIVRELELDDTSPRDLDADTPLFAGGLGLDSVDVLELAVLLTKKYGVVLKQDNDVQREAFVSVGSLAKFIEENRIR